MYDSSAQYLQAVQGQYSDHHPPIMSFLWHYLDLIHPGSGLMFALQLTLLYVAVLILMHTSDKILLNKRWLWNLILLLLPIYPQILIYEVVILKDVQFSCSFVLAAAALAYFTVSEKQPPILIAALLITLMIYGAAVKYQAQYCVIVLAMWLGALLARPCKIWLKIITGLTIYALIFSSLTLLNNYLVPQQNKNHSWQYVKLYDLAAMSIALNENLIPQSNKTAAYTENKLKNRFTYPAIDSLVFKHEPILKLTRDTIELENLTDFWFKTVVAHPLVYLKHRTINMSYILLTRPGYEREVQDIPLAFTNNFARNSIAYYFTEITIGVLFYIFMSHITVIVLGVLYFILAIRLWRTTKYATVLLGFSATALSMVVLLFFMSMAATPRYTFMSIIMIHAAHIFAYKCLAKLRLQTPGSKPVALGLK